jgi:hypothetical protein
MKMVKISFILLLLVLVPLRTICAQGRVIEPDVDGIRYQLQVSKDVNEYLDDLFLKFSEGYIDPDTALEKVGLLRHEYNKMVEPVPQESEMLHVLMNRMLSRIEYYFIHYKRLDRENPLINYQIAQARFEYLREEQRLRFLYR